MLTTHPSPRLPAVFRGSARHAAILLVACVGLGLFPAQGRAATPAPTITSFSPTSGPVGSMVAIKGTNFSALQSVVFAGDVLAAGSYTSTQITVTVPSGALTGVITITTAGGSASTATVFDVTPAGAPQITSAASATAVLGQPFGFQIAASQNPSSYNATGLPAGLVVKQSTGVISGTPTTPGTFSVAVSATNASGTGTATLVLTVAPLPFFTGETSLGNGVYYVGFSNGQHFGEYSYLSNPDYIYSYDLTGYEYLTDAKDANAGIYLYDFTSNTFFYTSPIYPYPYLYDFSLKSVVYFYQGTSHPRSFYDFATGKIITK